ncbi:ubiquitin conjugation factor E4 A [Chrysoperla carnea]|uniref:ubiquitin conjugation factor E4 A n=1 Tax=Chrysoperla carnea TaxID=189513 RepID=UPI001D099D9E|nr:ubiquitin conjugation factor E4 A [Chrysoperla carnea]
MASNPFAALVSSENGDSPAITSTNTPIIEKQASEKLKINEIVEVVFGFTLDKNADCSIKKQLIYLEELANNVKSQDWIDLEILDQCLFERLMLDDLDGCVLPSNTKPNNRHVFQKEVIIYLFDCLLILKKYERLYKDIVDVISQLIFRNVITAIKQPDVFVNQDIMEQFMQIIFSNDSYVEFFTQLAVNYLQDDDDVPLSIALKPLFIKIHAKIAQSTLLTINPKIFEFLNFLCSNDIYANIFIDYNTPIDLKAGSSFANTLLGALISLSILPKTNHGIYDYFDRPLEQVNSALEGNLWSATNELSDNLHRIFLNLLKKSSEVKTKTLNWIGKCLETNAARGKLWNIHAPPEMNPANFTTVSDGFMLTLASVLLKLCVPFCSNPASGKILKVDPTYCAVEDSVALSKGIHLLKMSEETCLIPAADSDSESSEVSHSRPTSLSYNFITECFYMAHRCLDLGFRISTERLLRQNQEMARIQRAYNDALMQANGLSEVMDTMKARMESEMQRYISLKAALLEPNFIANLMHLHTSTAVWLTQVAFHSKQTDSTNYAPITFENISFPLPDFVPDTLKCIPEFITENLVSYLSFLRRFSPRTLEEQGYNALAPILTTVLIFMGSPERMRNPHMRARLAECLEAMLPHHKDEPQGLNNLGGSQRERLFLEHPHHSEIVRNLLDVFVSIEMTGQSVQFEQKFNYRRPMYIIMDYLWELDNHKKAFMALAKEAEQNMEAVTPPTYLRFINLLMNDAVFLLDESLTNMAQIRTLETARTNGEWEQLSANEREQNMAHLQQIGMLARFDNILGRDTTRTLRLLTTNTASVFTHSTMVDRVAAMLNYFLLHLVGPKKKNFKVKDMKEYEFDPAVIVLDICHIYVSLASSNAFCLAISQDGRSYSPQLFSLAEDVLARIGGGQLISELRQLANKVEELARLQKEDDEIFTDIPDEFLDPIMSTLMTDPVILPSSKQTVDRNTISRHLLSDQTDPFNRSPLTMDQVIPNTDLATQIQEWIKQKRSGKSTSLD